MRSAKIDGFVKSASAALRCILRRCGVPPSTPHSSGFARLASGAFYFAIQILAFYEFIKIPGNAKILQCLRQPANILPSSKKMHFLFHEKILAIFG
ncbi:MAG: hypothetical protein NTY64_10730 [Deltaproteobacteria bacterium]|nr:hypothetical protein [Deltaproteobacteria bacterium]